MIQPKDKRRLLSQNSELRKHGIYNWSLPALVGTISGGRKIITCPAAGFCAAVCYARNGPYRFRNVRERHAWNLELVVDRLDLFTEWMTEECSAPKMSGRRVRIHDSGDFFSKEYLAAWLEVARAVPSVGFYTYTKEVSLFVREAEGRAPANFLWVYSLGGKEDSLIDRSRHRHADVFPDESAISAAGYTSQSARDTDCVDLPTNLIGIPANNIPAFRKKQGQATFSELEARRAAK